MGGKGGMMEGKKAGLYRGLGGGARRYIARKVVAKMGWLFTLTWIRRIS